jgi:hypothetical protein
VFAGAGPDAGVAAIAGLAITIDPAIPRTAVSVTIPDATILRICFPSPMNPYESDA